MEPLLILIYQFTAQKAESVPSAVPKHPPDQFMLLCSFGKKLFLKKFGKYKVKLS